MRGGKGKKRVAMMGTPVGKRMPLGGGYGGMFDAPAEDRRLGEDASVVSATRADDGGSSLGSVLRDSVGVHAHVEEGDGVLRVAAPSRASLRASPFDHRRDHASDDE
jgi:hypothetical protein